MNRELSFTIIYLSMNRNVNRVNQKREL